MSIICSLVWGLLTIVIMVLTSQYYLPILSKRIHTSNSNSLVDSAEKNVNNPCVVEKNDKNDLFSTEGRYISKILDNCILSILLLSICGFFSICCGYSAAIHSVSFISFIKMTIAMGVLSCIVITDMEFMIITNSCSLVLIVSRLLTMVYEMIWMKDEFLIWLLNSVIALLICLFFLLLMSRITRGGLGMGDVKLFSSFGFLCGIRTVFFTLSFAFLLCALFSSALLLAKKKGLSDSLPMGPFIWAGYGVTILLSII